MGVPGTSAGPLVGGAGLPDLVLVGGPVPGMAVCRGPGYPKPGYQPAG